MRRLWAHVSLAFASLVTVGATFTSVLTKTNANIEYQAGREITFRVSEKKDADNPEAVSLEGTQQIADEMIRRLGVAKVTRYEVDVAGDDTIKVKVCQNGDDDYTYLTTYLSFNGNLALSYGDDYIVADEFLTGDEARIETFNNYPCILLPVDIESESYKQLIDKARKDKADENREYAEEQSSKNGDTGEDETTYRYFLYLWYDFVEGKCTFEALQDSTNEYSERVLMKFQVNSNEDGTNENDDFPQYFPDANNNKLYSAINIDANGDGVASPEEKETAYARANYFINLINAGKLDYDVKALFNDTVTTDPWVECLVAYSSDSNHLVVAWSSTFAATLCAIVILAFLLVVYYRLGALSISTMSILSTYIGLLAVLLFKAEFNTFGIIGLGIVAIASIVSGVIYCNKIKEESYRGRSLKKANAEAAKKSLLPIVDVNVVVVVLGIFLYIFGGALMRNFAVITVFGGIASLILNTLGLKGMMWLATNTTKFQGKYQIFGIDPANVPNVINEEKQSYFGPYADKDFTAKKKPVGIVAAILVLASAAGLGVFGGIAAAKGGDLYSKGNKTDGISVYFETSNAYSTLTKDGTIEELLSNLMVYEGETPNDENTKSVLKEYVAKTSTGYAFNSYERTEQEDSKTTTYYITIVDFTKAIDAKYKLCYKESGTYTLPSPDCKNAVEMINDLLNNNGEDPTKTTIVAKTVEVYKEISPELGPIALGTLVAIGTLGIYFILRYRLSRGITSIIAALSTGVFTVGFLTLLRFINIPDYVVAALPFVVAFTFMLSIVLMNRERELVIEDKTHDNSVENRDKIMVKATSSAFAVILPITIFALYYGINFFGFGPSFTAWIYIMIILGIVAAALVVTTLFGPISQLFFRLFGGIKINKPKKAKKVTAVRTKKSAEPEEAVFIGIND